MTMLSRTADNLFWLSRYIERAENLARILDVARRLASLPSAYAGSSNEWESAIATASATEVFATAYPAATRESVVRFIVGDDSNPSSIRACIRIARANARAVRTAITGEMWEIVNDAWNAQRGIDPSALDDDSQLTAFLESVKAMSLAFDGAAYRTMLRTDHYRFQRLGTFLERADNMARLLDVKYHVVLPNMQPVGSGLDYFQWATILRGLGALTSYHWVYRDNLRPWLVADFLILRREQPRSLVSCYAALAEHLDAVADEYGRQGPAQRLARAMLGRLSNTDIDAVFAGGLHEFLRGFIVENNALGAAIARQYLA
jgi:uncharacterized alpha-E superfamily protein